MTEGWLNCENEQIQKDGKEGRMKNTTSIGVN